MFNQHQNGHSSAQEGASHPKVHPYNPRRESSTTSSARSNARIWNNLWMKWIIFIMFQYSCHKEERQKKHQSSARRTILNHYTQQLPVNLVTHLELFTHLEGKQWDLFGFILPNAAEHIFPSTYSLLFRGTWKIILLHKMPTRTKKLSTPSETSPQ